MSKIKVENTEISAVNVQNEDYISLTDMAHSQMQEHIIFRWMSLKSTIVSVSAMLVYTRQKKYRSSFYS